MKFEEFQRQWQSIKSKPKSHDELRRIMYSSPIPRVRRLTAREIETYIICISVLVFYSVWMGLFESWRTMPTGVWCIYAMIDHYFGIQYLRFAPERPTVRATLTDTLKLTRRLALVSRIANTLCWIVLVAVLAMNVYLGAWNGLLWALILSPLLVATIWWSSRKWAKNQDEVKAMLNGLGNENSNLSVM